MSDGMTDSVPKVRCRAKILGECYHGDYAYAHYEDGFIQQDGTWDGTSIVCDPCYLELLPFTRSGRGNNSELDEAIAAYRENLAYIQRSDVDPWAEIEKVHERLKSVRLGSPLHRSGMACVKMAEREIERRATT